MADRRSSRRGSERRPCAACVHQRRRCPENCILAPYFPQERRQDFLNVLRCFTVSYLSKSLAATEDPTLRRDAAESYIYEALQRAKHPLGCLRVMYNYENEIRSSQAELESVRRQLQLHRTLSPPPLLVHGPSHNVGYWNNSGENEPRAQLQQFPMQPPQEAQNQNIVAYWPHHHQQQLVQPQPHNPSLNLALGSLSSDFLLDFLHLNQGQQEAQTPYHGILDQNQGQQEAQTPYHGILDQNQGQQEAQNPSYGLFGLNQGPQEGQNQSPWVKLTAPRCRTKFGFSGP